MTEEKKESKPVTPELQQFGLYLMMRRNQAEREAKRFADAPLLPGDDLTQRATDIARWRGIHLGFEDAVLAFGEIVLGLDPEESDD